MLGATLVSACTNKKVDVLMLTDVVEPTKVDAKTVGVPDCTVVTNQVLVTGVTQGAVTVVVTVWVTVTGTAVQLPAIPPPPVSQVAKFG